jgi:hypothetical protein
MMTTRTRMRTTITDAPPTSRKDRVAVERAKPAVSGSRPALERGEREAGARRALVVASLAGLIGAFGVVAGSERPLQAADDERPFLVSSANPGRVVAEVPIPSADGQGIETVVRFIAPEPDAPESDVRTRATS